MSKRSASGRGGGVKKLRSARPSISDETREQYANNSSAYAEPASPFQSASQPDIGLGLNGGPAHQSSILSAPPQSTPPSTTASALFGGGETESAPQYTLTQRATFGSTRSSISGVAQESSVHDERDAFQSHRFSDTAVQGSRHPSRDFVSEPAGPQSRLLALSQFPERSDREILAERLDGYHVPSIDQSLPFTPISTALDRGRNTTARDQAVRSVFARIPGGMTPPLEGGSPYPPSLELETAEADDDAQGSATVGLPYTWHPDSPHHLGPPRY